MDVSPHYARANHIYSLPLEHESIILHLLSGCFYRLDGNAHAVWLQIDALGTQPFSTAQLQPLGGIMMPTAEILRDLWELSLIDEI